MPKFILSGEINCGVTYEVEADDRAQANDIMGMALMDHIEQGCDGVTIVEVEDDELVELGVRVRGQDMEVDKLDYYDRSDA